MATFEVTIEAVVRKTYTVNADDSYKAQEIAQEMFSVVNEPGVDEYYSQEVIETLSNDPHI